MKIGKIEPEDATSAIEEHQIIQTENQQDIILGDAEYVAQIIFGMIMDIMAVILAVLIYYDRPNLH